jgi:hypothetical protein
LAISQALALGPLIGFSQAAALRPYTQRWKWWIAANFVSWLTAQALFYAVSLILGGFDFAHGNGSPLEAYLVLLAATPLSGRWMLWVTAPDATVPVADRAHPPHPPPRPPVRGDAGRLEERLGTSICRLAAAL